MIQVEYDIEYCCLKKHGSYLHVILKNILSLVQQILLNLEAFDIDTTWFSQSQVVLLSNLHNVAGKECS